MLTLHQYHMSPYNEKIQRMLFLKGVPLHTHPAKQAIGARHE